MDVFSTEQRYWTANDLETVQILADVATAYLVHARRSVEAERLAAQAAASELRFRSLVEPSPDPVIRLGADGVVLAANRATHDLANIDEHPAIGETLVGASVSELAVLHPALAAVAKQWPRLADITNPVAMERIEADSSGDRRHFRARFVPVGDHDEPAELLIVLTDVRRRRTRSVARAAGVVRCVDGSRESRGDHRSSAGCARQAPPERQ